MTRWGVRRLSIRGALAPAECQVGGIRPPPSAHCGGILCPDSVTHDGFALLRLIGRVGEPLRRGEAATRAASNAGHAPSYRARGLTTESSGLTVSRWRKSSMLRGVTVLGTVHAAFTLRCVIVVLRQDI